jgi:hypothetical protein
MRIVGTTDRSGIELDPVKAYRRGLILDAMLAAAARRCWETDSVLWASRTGIRPLTA